MVNEGGMVKWWEMQIKWVSRLCQPSTNPVKDNFLLSIKGERRGKTQEHWDRKRWRAAERKKKIQKKKKRSEGKPSWKNANKWGAGCMSKDYDNFPTTNEHENPTGDNDSQRSNSPGPRTIVSCCWQGLRTSMENKKMTKFTKAQKKKKKKICAA